jgi:hypothetical protein
VNPTANISISPPAGFPNRPDYPLMFTITNVTAPETQVTIYIEERISPPNNAPLVQATASTPTPVASSTTPLPTPTLQPSLTTPPG